MAEHTIDPARNGYDTSPAAQWPIYLVVSLLGVAAAFAVFNKTFFGMVYQWANSDAFGHAFLILPISVYLIWLRREQVAKIAPKPSLLGLVGLILCTVAWLLSHVAGIVLTENFAFVGIIQALVLTLLGWRVFWALLFPLMYLFLMVPFGEFLIPWLQDITAALTVHWLRWVGIPVFLDGVMMAIPTGSFEVAEACAGLRFLIAVFALGLLYANLMYQDWPRRVGFMVVAVITTIVANGIRAFGIVVTAYLTDHEVAVGADHVVYGWVFLTIVMVILFFLGLWIKKIGSGGEPTGSHGNATPSTAAPGSKASLLASALAAALVMVGASAYAAQLDGATTGRGEVALTAPHVAAPWAQSSAQSEDWRPYFKGADGELFTRYQSSDNAADLYIAYYKRQRQGAEIVNSQNFTAAAADWTRLEDLPFRVTLDGQEFDVLATVFAGIGAERRLVLRWFWVGDRMTGSEHVAKLIQTWATLTGGEEAAAAIVISAPYEDEPTDVIRALNAFVEALGPIRESLKDVKIREADLGSSPGQS